MLDYKKDFKATKLLLLGNVVGEKYNRLYFSSNERLDEIFSYFDFKDKDVLSVIGSGDQAISFFNKGVNRVDLFDINKLAIYYYYLRIWAIKYQNDIYPGTGEKTIEYIKKLLKYVFIQNNDELNAYNYWNLFVENFSNYDIMSFFYSCYYPLYKEEFNLENLKENIEHIDSKIMNIDLSGNFSIDNKYDYLYTSNIVDYISIKNIIAYRDNIYNLLKDNGIVICSNLSTDSIDEEIKCIFEERFKFGEISKIPSEITIPGYYYIKR